MTELRRTLPQFWLLKEVSTLVLGLLVGLALLSVTVLPSVRLDSSLVGIGSRVAAAILLLWVLRRMLRR